MLKTALINRNKQLLKAHIILNHHFFSFCLSQFSDDDDEDEASFYKRLFCSGSSTILLKLSSAFLQTSSLLIHSSSESCAYRHCMNKPAPNIHIITPSISQKAGPVCTERLLSSLTREGRPFGIKQLAPRANKYAPMNDVLTRTENAQSLRAAAQPPAAPTRPIKRLSQNLEVAAVKAKEIMQTVDSIMQPLMRPSMPIATHICLRLNVVMKNDSTSETISHAKNPQLSSQNPNNFYDSASIPTTEDMKTIPAITFGRYLRPQNATNGPLTIMMSPKSHGYRYINSVKLKSAASMHPALLSIMTLTSQPVVSTLKTFVTPVLQASSVVKL